MMIAETPAIAQPQSQTEPARIEQPSMTVGRVVASLQVLLATRRAARNEDHAYWYTIARGM